MSQFNLENLRSVSTDPNQRNINELAKKLSRHLSKTIDVNLDDEEDLIANGVQIDDGIKFNDTFFHHEQFSDWTQNYYPITDNDGGLLSTWLRCDHLGSGIIDRSQFNSNNAELNGDPKLIDGGFDMGYLGGTYKSLALRFNRPTSDTVNAEWLEVPDDTSLHVTGLATGFSLFMRVKIHDFAQQGGTTRNLFCKTDDDATDNGYMLRLQPEGKFKFAVSKSGTDYDKQTTNTFTTGVLYDIFLTYAVSGNTLKIYVNGSEESGSTTGTGINYPSDPTNHNLFIMRRGDGTAGSFAYADLYDFKFWSERIISSTEVAQHYVNKNSVDNHAFGEIPFADHCTPYIYTGPSFTSSSFTSDSFMTSP